jgi:hypothetical protein
MFLNLVSGQFGNWVNETSNHALDSKMQNSGLLAARRAFILRTCAGMGCPLLKQQQFASSGGQYNDDAQITL